MPTEHNLLIKAKEAVENNELIQAGEYLDELLREEPNNDEAWALAAKIIHDPTNTIIGESKLYDGTISADGKSLIFIAMPEPSNTESSSLGFHLYLYEREIGIFN